MSIDEGPEELSGQQRNQLIGWTVGQLRAWENEHCQNKIGLFTEDEFLARRVTWSQRLTLSAFRER